MKAPRGKKVSGKDYAEVDEKYQKKMKKKQMRSMKTAGIAALLKKSENSMGYSKMPRLKSEKMKGK